MKTTTVFTLLLASLATGSLTAQTIAADPKKWAAHNCSADFSDNSIHLTNTSGKTAVLWAKDINFKNGVIELDVKGKDVRGESFIGVAFHADNNDKYNAVYFRPFNFRDPERKDRAVQYVDIPANDWDVLREKTPGKYEHAIVPDTDPNDWFHAKIVIQYPAIKVFVNGSTEPALEVEQIGKKQDGPLGLWIDCAEGWFKNVMIKQDKMK